MSVSAVAPTPFYQDPDRLQIAVPQASAEGDAVQGGGHLTMFAEGDDAPSFWDVLDIINPLQHIPIVKDIYQELTGDKIGVGARVAGGALFGGPIGLFAAITDCAIEDNTGKDAGEHVLALFRDDPPATPGEAPATLVAAADPTPTPAPVAVALADKAPAALAAVEAAPVIALPEDGAAARSGSAARTTIYSLDGATMPAAAPAAATAAPAAPLGGHPVRLMPVPARTQVDPRDVPALSVPVSTSQSRSNIPVTGRAPAMAAAQRVVAGQSVPAAHPMVPPAAADGQSATSPDWFTSAWSEALDKYQRANRRNDARAETAVTTVN